MRKRSKPSRRSAKAAKKAAPKRATRRREVSLRAKKTSARKPAAAKKSRKKAKSDSAARRRDRRAGSAFTPPLDTRGLGPEAGGQAGDTEGLSRAELADSESVEELLEEGQAFEAGVVSGIAVSTTGRGVLSLRGANG